MKKVFKIIVPTILVIGIIASIGWYLFVYDRDLTRDVLLAQARFSDTQGHPNAASFFYDLAYSHSGHEENIAIELANQYKSDGNYTKAEYTLSNAIADGGTAELYIALCKTYVEQDKLLDAVNMLDNIANPVIKEQLDKMRPAAPSSETAPGFYSEYISVDLSSDMGTLYYTLDGEYPSTEDAPYSDPIALPAGETTIYAVSVDQSGLVSPLTILGYTIGGVIEEVSFTDPAMEAAIRTLLEVDEDKVLYTNNLWDITEFTVPSDAATFDDLALLPYVTSLTVEEKTFDSLNCLTGLIHLEDLKLIGCKFPDDDLSILANLPALKKLTMSDCGLSTIAKLTNAQSLTHLDLSNNTIRNLEPLSSMTTLVEVNLQHNAVTSLNALSPLTNLEKLDVSYNSLTSVAPIATCLKLSRLDVSFNTLANLGAVDNLPALTHLYVRNNDLTDVSILQKCTGLVELNISNNSISDISSLSTLTALETFDFSYNEVESLPKWPDGSVLYTINGSYNKLTSIDNLKNMEELGYVYMDYNKLTNINAIADCYHLVLVNVYGNTIKDVSALTDHNIIVNYDPT